MKGLNKLFQNFTIILFAQAFVVLHEQRHQGEVYFEILDLSRTNMQIEYQN